MMERHVTDRFLWYTEYTDENRSDIRLLYEEALNGDKEALVELMNKVCECGYRDGYETCATFK